MNLRMKPVQNLWFVPLLLLAAAPVWGQVDLETQRRMIEEFKQEQEAKKANQVDVEVRILKALAGCRADPRKIHLAGANHRQLIDLNKTLWSWQVKVREPGQSQFSPDVFN